MLQIGFRAHDFGKFDSIEELASTIETFKAPACIQLALKKVIPNAPDACDYTQEYIDSIRTSLNYHGTNIAVIGCYINPVHPDEQERQAHLQRFETNLRFTKEFGCKVVGTETGSLQPNCSYHPDTSDPKVFDTLCRSIEQLLNTAQKHDAIVAVEAVSRQHTICSVPRMYRLLQEFDTPHLKVIYDPVNLVPWLGIPEQDGSVRTQPTKEAQQAFVREALDVLGNRIIAIHAKDYSLDANGWKIGDIPLGTGVMDWAMIFHELQVRNIDVPILLENLNPATLPQTLEYLQQF